MSSFRRLSDKIWPTPKYDAISNGDLPKIEDLERSEGASATSSLPQVESQFNRGGPPTIVKLFLLSLVTALAFLSRKLFTDYVLLGHDALLRTSESHQALDLDPPISVSAPPVASDPIGAKLADRSDWIVRCSSQKDEKHDCRYAIDQGGVNTEWQSEHIPHTSGHWIAIDLNQTYNVHSLAVTPSKRWKKQGGSARKHNVEIAADDEGPWDLVEFGAWRDSSGVKYATFEPQVARFVRLWVIDSSQDKDFVAISDINIYVVDEMPPVVPNGGQWGITVNFPIVPVTAFVNPKTHDVVTLASYRPNTYKAYEAYETYTSTWYIENGIVEEEIVDVTEHDMFCPGTSLDEQGRVVVTGGSTPRAISIYDSVTGSWSTPNNTQGRPLQLKLGRGYHGQTFLPNGQTFMIGGEWSNGHADKDGETYDPTTETMTVLRGVKASMIKMDPSQSCDPPIMRRPCFMNEWRQHHPWLYVWKNGSIFHPGPSRKMNWFFTTPPHGDSKDGGYREDEKTGVADRDAVSGIAVMYDAEEGLILTAGGAPNYDYWHDKSKRGPNDGHRVEASTMAFEIKLGGVEPGEIVRPRQIASTLYARQFANAVVLPDGETMVVGGQRQGEPFIDDTWHRFPEIYSPETETWREAAPNSIPRVYHSWAMLMPDATVLVGGGGLENPETDHYDAQVYAPAYLFQSDGKTPAERPSIAKIDGHSFIVGDKITVTTDVEIDSASLIRYSAATHALNNDLRRIKLTVVQEGDSSNKQYSMRIPDDASIALPGYWMLFVLRVGVPSVSETVQILAE